MTVSARERRVDRYYDPSTEQFLSVDPDVAESGQPYAFTGDDPLNATDPTGDLVYESAEAGGEESASGQPCGEAAVQLACNGGGDTPTPIGQVLSGLAQIVLVGGIGPEDAAEDALGDAAADAIRSVIDDDAGGTFTADHLGTVRDYLSSQGFFDDPANNAMVDRIQSAIDSGRPLTQGEQNFMTHELTEANLVNDGMSQEAAHEIASGTHPPFSNYDPAVISQYPELFNENWFHYWEGG